LLAPPKLMPNLTDTVVPAMDPLMVTGHPSPVAMVVMDLPSMPVDLAMADQAMVDQAMVVNIDLPIVLVLAMVAAMVSVTPRIFATFRALKTPADSVAFLILAT